MGKGIKSKVLAKIYFRVNKAFFVSYIPDANKIAVYINSSKKHQVWISQVRIYSHIEWLGEWWNSSSDNYSLFFNLAKPLWNLWNRYENGSHLSDLLHGYYLAVNLKVKGVSKAFALDWFCQSYIPTRHASEFHMIELE